MAKPQQEKERAPAPEPGIAHELWPASSGHAAVTPDVLGRYYESVASWLLPYITGRPCTAVIAMQGSIAGECFFQRHGGQLIGGLGVSPVLAHPYLADRDKAYLQFDTPEALIEAARNYAVELHPWNCVEGLPNLPGRLVFDLDPAEDLDFAPVVKAAFEVRDRLKAMGMESWLKTTGGKGLHVVTLLRQRLGQPTTWPEAKAFALRLCRAIEADSPTAYTTKMAKAERHGRIFLDYLRNDTTATAAALLTPRTRSGAPVSFPLRWEDLTPDLDRDAYTIWNAAELMANSDPWEGYEASARPLPS